MAEQLQIEIWSIKILKQPSGKQVLLSFVVLQAAKKEG
jgi:hypothetical protein